MDPFSAAMGIASSLGVGGGSDSGGTPAQTTSPTSTSDASVRAPSKVKGSKKTVNVTYGGASEAAIATDGMANSTLLLIASIVLVVLFGLALILGG